jgi:hypothetical protein
MTCAAIPTRVAERSVVKMRRSSRDRTNRASSAMDLFSQSSGSAWGSPIDLHQVQRRLSSYDLDCFRIWSLIGALVVSDALQLFRSRQNTVQGSLFVAESRIPHRVGCRRRRAGPCIARIRAQANARIVAPPKALDRLHSAAVAGTPSLLFARILKKIAQALTQFSRFVYTMQVCAAGVRSKPYRLQNHLHREANQGE